MKSLFLALMVSGAMLITSCTKDNILDDTPQEVTNTVTEGTWRISYFWDDKDETSHFNGYDFTFNSNGTLSATNSSQTYSGTWSTGTDDSQLKLTISFVSPADFEELSDDWHIIERSDNLIKLEDVSGGDGSIDYLNFTKN
jgi:major membrane immunogen (membrane-anchored lipoprotein)